MTNRGRGPTSTLSRRAFMKQAGAAGVTALGAGALSHAQEPEPRGRRPNLLFVFSDEQSWDMLGCYGNDQVITPHIDQLAAEGIRFNHCVSSSPVCTPYRGMLMSGQHPLYCGALANDMQLLVNNGTSFGQALRNAGYRTGYVGKWHLYGGCRNRAIPPGIHRHGFDDCFLSNNCHVDYDPGDCYYWNDAGKKTFLEEWEVFGQTRQALDFLDGCTDEHPFALFVSWHPPHDNGRTQEGVWRYETIPELMGMYDPDKIRLRPNFNSNVHDIRSYHGHMAMCTGVDIAFGWLMEKLRANGLDGNTIVVFTSDHGDLLGSNGRPWPKGFPEDGSVRVPLIVRWPRHLQPGTVSDLLVGALDLMPTLLSLMGLDLPTTCQGQDLTKAILAADADAVSSVPLFLFPGNWRGVYTHRYTYSTTTVQNPKLSFRTLYDKHTDPLQMDNLYGKPEQRTVQDELHQLTLEWMSRFDDTFLSIDQIAKVCFADGTRPTLKPGQTGELLGRPVDLIRQEGAD